MNEQSHRNTKGKIHGLSVVCAHLLLLLMISCTAIEEKRIRQLLNEKGFGGRAQGIATIENYVAGRDLVGFIIRPEIYQQPGAESLFLLSSPQPVGIDGTILIPHVGPVYVLGLTEREIKNLVETQLGEIFNFPITVQPRIVNRGKVIYLFGEIRGVNKIPLLEADLTLLELLATVPLSALANWGRIQLIRPDAENPMVMVINVREMILTGNTTYNIPLQDNDIIYVPPTFIGHLTRFVEKLLLPLSAGVNALFGLARAEAAYDFVFNDEKDFFFGGRTF